jgi:hypothetical protein
VAVRVEAVAYLAGLVMLGCAACGDLEPPQSGAADGAGSTTVAAPPTPPEAVPSVDKPLPIDDYECDLGGGDGVCGDGVVLGDVQYGFTCALPRRSELGGVVGTPGSDDRFSEARAVAGEDPGSVIVLVASQPLELESSFAVLGKPNTCPAGVTHVLAFGGSWAQKTAEDAQRIAHLVCEVPEVPDDVRCPEGGPFQYFLDPSPDGTEGDENRSFWLDDAVTSTNAALRAGEGPRHRLDPLDLVERDHDYVQRPSLRSGDVLYRVGARIVDQSPGRVVVEVLHQEGGEEGGKLVYITQREEFTYEQLGGGPGWWETRFIMREYSNDNWRTGPDARSLMDADWSACCDRVLINLEA